MALDIFLSIPSIPGESEAANFRGTIPTSSYAWALENDETAFVGGRGRGKTTFQPLTVTKVVDKASPLLMRALARSTTIAAMTLLLERSGGDAQTKPFLVYQFSDVLVLAVADSGSSGGDDVPSESVTFAFGVYQARYRKTLPDGMLSPIVLTSEWSVLTNSVPKGPSTR